MSYVGNTVTTQGFIPAVDYFNGTGSATAFTLSKPVASVAQVEAVISNVVQNPSDAYTVSGNTITFTSAPPSGTNNVYVRYTSPITQVIAPGQGTVTGTSLNSGSTTGTGNIVLATSPTLVTPALGTPSALVLTNATGLPQAGLGTNVAGNGPAFSATPTTTQSVTTATYTKVNLGTENFDTNSNFDSTTNYRFTPTVAGYYQLNGSIYPVSTNSANYIWSFIYKTGAIYASGSSAGAASTQDGISVVSTLVYLNGSTDYVELYCYVTGTSPVIQNSLATQFSGFLARSA